MRLNFLLPFWLFSGDGCEFVVESSLSCEESGRVLIWNFQYASDLSVSCRFGLLAHYWVPGKSLAGVLDGRLL